MCMPICTNWPMCMCIRIQVFAQAMIWKQTRFLQTIECVLWPLQKQVIIWHCVDVNANPTRQSTTKGSLDISTLVHRICSSPEVFASIVCKNCCVCKQYFRHNQQSEQRSFHTLLIWKLVSFHFIVGDYFKIKMSIIYSRSQFQNP